ncbi:MULTISPECIES: DUF2255 family protein [unclassified Streptomyces]|uniref:DUF2255 family protein n=1 Tax=unclassified Streptomyces TaxID=2593676 RepID=UPI002E19E53B|nr:MULTISPECIES: DUF2255 family protein [unclassified Streptomyces]
MAAWTDAELERIAQAEEIDLESERGDGTLRDPVTMWMVRDGDFIYVRSVKGREGPWFRGAQTRHQGRVRAGGVTKDVTFEDADPGVSERVDAAYRAKYSGYPSIVEHVLTPQSQEATLQLVPR